MDVFIDNINVKGQKKLAKEFFDKITNNQVPDLDKMLNINNIIKIINSKINETPKIKLEEFKNTYNKKDFTHSGTQYMSNFNGKTVEKMSDYYNVMKSFLTNFLNMYKNNIEKINNLPKCDYTSMFKIAFNVMCKGVGKMAELECLDSKFPNREKSVYKKDILGTERLEVAREGLFEIIVFGPILATLGIGGTMYAYEKGKELVKKLLNIKDKAEVLKIENIEGTYKPSKAILKLCKHLGSLKEVIKYIDILGSLKGEQSSVKDMKNVTYYKLSKYLKTKPIQNFKHIDFKLNNLKSELLENLSENLHYLLTDLADKNKLNNIGFEDLGNLDMKSKEGENKLWDKVSELYTEISNSLNLKVKNQEPLLIVPCNDEVYTFVRATIDIEFKFNNKQWKTEVVLQTFTDCDDIDINDVKVNDKDIESIKNCLNKNRENIEKLFHYNSVVYDGNICNKWFKDECFIGNEFITHITCFYDDYEPYYFESYILGKFIKDVYPNAKSIKVKKESISTREFNNLTLELEKQNITYNKEELIYSKNRIEIYEHYDNLIKETQSINKLRNKTGEN